jgi:hypothetical protein
MGTKSLFFGICPGPFDQGVKSSIAINGSKTVVEIHTAQGLSNQLWWQLGGVGGVSLDWRGHGTVNDDSGHNPSVALNDQGVVLEVHDSGGGALWYWTGQVSGTSIAWKDHGKYDSGVDPAVAVNRNGVVVEVHQSNGLSTKLWWWVGQLSGTSITWTGHASLEDDSGYNPSVAVNNNGLVVEVHDSGAGTLWYWIGQVSGDTINWHGHAQYDTGSNPSVSLTDDGMVYEAHQGTNQVWQRIGRVVDNAIQWIDVLGTGAESYYYDDGVRPQIAVNGGAGVQVHSSETFSDLYANASLVFDRAGWMGDNLAKIGGTALRQLALPASHDAGMYPGGLAVFGKTQDLNLYSQLSYGVRYFDLRPKYTGGEFILYHGPIDGPKLTDVLAQIRSFYAQGHRELAILKFSHYDGFDQTVFTKLCQLLQDKNSGLGDWLYYTNAPQQPRLADRTLQDYLGQRGTALVVCDGSWAFPSSPSPSGLFRYRDWESDDPQNGDLTVFDIYSNTMSFETMATSTEASDYGLPRGQLPKFQGFNGTCYKNAAVPCDLFLLSWTLTPPTAVWSFSRLANKELVDYLAPVGPNRSQKIVNLLYTDYVEYSRSTDVAVVRNGCAPA